MSKLLVPDRWVTAQRVIAGRARELDVFRGAFDRMLTGHRQVVLISGEPGIGKTRCAEALAEMAEDQGALVLWGRCHEEVGAPPYWPWVQILRGYVDASSPDEVRLTMGGAANEIAALVPEVADSALRTDAAPGVMADATAARFRTFDAVGQVLRRASQQVPVTLILDNLHWADALSLSLIEFVTQNLTRSRLLIVGTFRQRELSSASPLRCTLGGLQQEPGVQRVQLAGLSEQAIAEIAEHMCGVALSAPTIRTIYERTDGNPLFAIELIKVMLDESAGSEIPAAPAAIPAGVRETIGRRLSRLPARCNDLLSVAAVYGRQFTAQELAAAADGDLHNILKGLEPAVQADIIQAAGDFAGSYQFTHALIRDTIYEDVPTADRLALHGRAGDALARVHAAQLERALTRIAHHYYQAAPLGNADRAVTYALRAAESATRVYAYEDALQHYDSAISLLEGGGHAHDERLARAYILKGFALKQLGQIQRSMESLLEAVNRTRVLGNAELLVDVLVLFAIASQHIGQQHFVPLLERTLALLPDVESTARAKALAALAFAQRTSADHSRLQRLVDESLAMANRTCDAATRCACYHLTIMALRGSPESLHRRLLIGDEYLAVARLTGNPELLAEACHWQSLNYLESGDIDELEALLTQYENLSSTRYGLHQYLVGAHRVTLLLLRGDWSDVEQRIETLKEVGTQTRREDADGVYGAQMFALNRDLGRLQALAPEIERAIASGTVRLWEPGLMLICADVGLMAEARAIFERFVGSECKSIRRDDMYVTCLVLCAETCYLLADTARAVALYRLLQPYAGQAANHPTAVCFGACELYLGMLAHIARWPEVTREHYSRALAFNRAMRAWPALARTLYRFGSFLATCETNADRRLGLQHLREAEDLARRLGMARLVSEIEASLHVRDGGSAFPDELTAREVEVLQLLAMGRTNKDVSAVLAISLNTVATHVRNILNKTRCANRTEAARYAIQHRLQGTHSDSITIAPAGR